MIYWWLTKHLTRKVHIVGSSASDWLFAIAVLVLILVLLIVLHP